MTTTNDERREIAAKMRGNADDMPFYGDLVADAAGADFEDDEDCWNCLADLIDPDNIRDKPGEIAHGLSEPTPTSSDRGPTCDRNALLELADRVQLIHSDPLKRGREACDYYGIGGDLDCEDCEAYTSDSRCLDLAIADVSRRIRAIANGLEGGSDAPEAGDEGHGGTDAHYDDCYDVEGHHIIDLSDKFNENIAAIDWVREQGGLDAVKARLMPEGMEWPRFDDGAPVRFEDEWCPRTGGTAKVGQVVLATDGGFALNASWYEPGERVKRPAPKVLDADGVEIREGDTLYYVDGREQRVNTVARLTDSGHVQFGTINEAGYVTYCEAACIQPNLLTHRAPVLAADGKPLREGETVWKKDGSYSFSILKIDGNIITMEDGLVINACYLTHERPDSWERLEEDAKLGRCGYNKAHGYPACCIGCDGLPLSDSCSGIMARDLVRRAKALAERGE